MTIFEYYWSFNEIVWFEKQFSFSIERHSKNFQILKEAIERFQMLSVSRFHILASKALVKGRSCTSSQYAIK